MREKVAQACEALRAGKPKNMGESVDVFDVVANEDEAAAIASSYAYWLMMHNGIGESEANDLARRNIMTGLSYMSRDTAHDIFTRHFAQAGNDIAKAASE